MREVARSRNLLSDFVTTLKWLFESVMETFFCLLLYVCLEVVTMSKGSYELLKKVSTNSIPQAML